MNLWHLGQTGMKFREAQNNLSVVTVSVPGTAVNDVGLEKKLAIVVRGPVGAGKTTLIKELETRLSKERSVRSINLDIHSGVSSNHRPRSYHNLDLVTVDCVLIELTDGGDATKNPHKWVDKLTSQGYSVRLFVLDAPLDELRRRTAIREGWNDAFTVGSWNSYKYDPNFIDFAKKLGMTQPVIDTVHVTAAEATETILKSLT